MKKKLTLLLAAVFTVMAVSAQEPAARPIDSAQSTVPTQSIASPQSIDIEERVEALEKDVSKLKNLKVSGYIQGQFQWGQPAASLKVGSANENSEKSFGRFGIRRGRLKFAYEQGIASAVFQLDITESGVGIKDAYLNIKDPWIKSMNLRAGVFDRPFGYEISYSSSRRESPERSTVFQTLFPNERDLGAMLVLQAPASSPWSILKLEAGLFAGNGIKMETDSKRDFIGHLSAAKEWNKIAFGAGVSYYGGKVYQGTQNVYTMSGAGFVLNDDAANKGKFAKREYVDLDAQFVLNSILGQTRLNGEYLFGKQPGTENGSKSPNSSSLPASDTYLRKFSGGYVMLVQNLGKTPVALIGKYDWYDPNTKVSGDETGLNGTGPADAAVNAWGVGALWDVIPAIRLTAYYEFVGNEKSANLAGYAKNRKDNAFTLRLQYKF